MKKKSKEKFEALQLGRRREVIYGSDKKNKYFIKIQVKKNPRKEMDIAQEFEVIKFLNEKGCQTCPNVYELGKLAKSEIVEMANGDPAIIEALDSAATEEFEYLVQEHITNNEKPSLADIMLTLIEQKKLGIYQGDI
jgi:hypothetical protein